MNELLKNGAVHIVEIQGECPYDWCAGTGWIEERTFDDSYIRKCLCKIDDETNASVDVLRGN